MLRNYVCIDCGSTFTLDTQMRTCALRCPECKDKMKKVYNDRYVDKQRRKLFEKR